MIKDYIAIARPGHWFKNIFILPGLAMAYFLVPLAVPTLTFNIILGIISVCLITSANYTINEWLDAEFDRHHPLKKGRPSVQGLIKFKFVILQYTLLLFVGLLFAFFVGMAFFWTSFWLLIMGIIYNVKPFRTKDKPYLDVLSESINNPIRLLLGWFMVTAVVYPPSSLIIAYWMGGAFLMAVKRYSELRLLNSSSSSNKSVAALYRKSFSFYTENNLLVSILFYAMSFAFFFGVFMLKYRIELLLSMPFFAILFAWYLHIGMMKDSSAQRPERLYREKKFMTYVCFMVILVITLFLIDSESLQLLLRNGFTS